MRVSVTLWRTWARLSHALSRRAVLTTWITVEKRRPRDFRLGRGRRHRLGLQQCHRTARVGSRWVRGRVCVNDVCGEFSNLFSSRSPATRLPLTGTCCCSSSWNRLRCWATAFETPARAGGPGRWKHGGTRGQQQLAGPLPQSVCVRCHAILCLLASLPHRLIIPFGSSD